MARFTLFSTVFKGLVALAFVVAAWFVLNNTNSQPNLNQPPSGEITSPANGTILPRSEVEVAYNHNNLPEDHHLWLVVGDGAIYYPKGRELDIKINSSSQKLNGAQIGAKKQAKLVLLLATDDGHNIIMEHMNKGIETGDYSSGVQSSAVEGTVLDFIEIIGGD